MRPTDQSSPNSSTPGTPAERPRVRDYLARAAGRPRARRARGRDHGLARGRADAGVLRRARARRSGRSRRRAAFELSAADAGRGRVDPRSPRADFAGDCGRVRERFGLGRRRPRGPTLPRRLEAGDLDASRVSRRLLDALGGLLGAARSRRASRASPAGRRTLFRAEAADDDRCAPTSSCSAAPRLSPAPAPMDELDRLFTGGPDA